MVRSVGPASFSDYSQPAQNPNVQAQKDIQEALELAKKLENLLEMLAKGRKVPNAEQQIKTLLSDADGSLQNALSLVQSNPKLKQALQQAIDQGHTLYSELVQNHTLSAAKGTAHLRLTPAQLEKSIEMLENLATALRAINTNPNK